VRVLINSRTLKIIEASEDECVIFKLSSRLSIVLFVVIVVNVSALKIHMSEDAHDALKEYPGFMIEPRGEIAVKVNLFSR